MSEKVWFWEWEGERRGPESAETLQSMLQEGTIEPTALVWKEGMADWAPFSTTALMEKEKPTPPALPPKPESPEVAAAPPYGEVLQPLRPPVEIPFREARLRSDFRPRIRSTLGRAWELLKSDFWPFVGFFTLMVVLVSVASQLLVPLFFLMVPLVVGFSWYVVNRMRNRAASIDDLFVGFKRGFGDLALVNLVLYTPIVLGSLLFTFAAIIGIFALAEGGGELDAVAWSGIGVISLLVFLLFTCVSCLVYAISNFASILVVDCGLDWREAIGLGWRACKPHLGKMIVYYLVISLVSSLGMFALYVGVLVTSAWAMIAMTILYEDAFGDESE